MTFINQEFSNLSTTVTNSTYQTTTATYQHLSGSRVLYTPEINSTYVYYQFLFQQTYGTTDDSLIHLKLVSGSNISQVNSSPADVEGSYVNTGDNLKYTRKTCFYRKLIPAWEGEKVLQLNFRHYSSAHVADVNRIDLWSGTTGLTIDSNSFLLVSSIF